MKKIACFFVNYNNSSKSITCVESLANQLRSQYSVEIFIIDNNSIAKEVGIIKEFASAHQLKGVSLDIIYLEENIGYFPALNYGYLLKKEIVTCCEYVIIGNNDLMFSSSFLQVLGEKKYQNDIFVISPNIVNSDNNHQNPQIIHKYTQMQLLYLDLYHSSYFMACLIGAISKLVKFRGSQKSKSGYSKSQYISIGYGACYVLTNEFNVKIGEIPSYLFLMNEENALTDLVLKNNGRIYYESELIVHHLEHSSINLTPKRKMYKIVKESYKISKKHFNNKYLFDKKIKLQ